MPDSVFAIDEPVSRMNIQLMGKFNSSTFVGLSIFALVLNIRAGEFPDNWTWDRDDKARSEHAALEGKPMPALDLSGWVNGEVKPADMKGKVVVVDFYATWCGPCMAAIPHNNELLKKYKDKGLVIVGVCTNKRGQEKMEATVKEKGIEYPTARDPQLKSQDAWAVHYYPTYAVVDRKGVVRSIGLQPQNVEKVVKKLLDESAAQASLPAQQTPVPASSGRVLHARQLAGS